jgi:O-methyltransferase
MRRKEKLSKYSKKIAKILMARLLNLFPLVFHFRRKNYSYISEEFCASAYKLCLPSENKKFNEIALLARSDKRTMLYFDRLFSIYNCIKSSASTNKSSDFSSVEVGVYRGGGSLFILNSSEYFSKVPVHHYAIDTYSGHSSLDLNQNIETTHKIARFTKNSFDDVKSYLAMSKNISVIQGRIQDVAANINDKFNFVHLDMDLYEPTKFALDFFSSRMKVGGIIVVDDFGFKTCPGIVRAVDEFFEVHDDFHGVPTLSGQYLFFKLN